MIALNTKRATPAQTYIPPVINPNMVMTDISGTIK
jgi:hypothetical protein